MLGASYDNSLDRIYFFSNSRIFQVVVVDEDRDMWSLYLNRARSGHRADFDTAFRACKVRRLWQYYVEMPNLCA